MFKFIGKKYKSVLRISIASSIITLLLGITILSSIIVKQKIDELSGNIIVSVIFKKTDNEDTLKPVLNKIKQQEWVSDFDYVSPEKAQNDFQKKYGNISHHLSPVIPFPAVANIKIPNIYKHQQAFYTHVKFLEHFDLVDQVSFRRNFVASIFSIYNQTYFIFIVITIFVLITSIFLFWLAIKQEFIVGLEDYSNYNFFGSIKHFKPIHLKLFIIIDVLIGIIIGKLILIALWWYSKDFLVWFEQINKEIFLYILLSIFIFFILCTFIMHPFLKVKAASDSSPSITEITE